MIESRRKFTAKLGAAVVAIPLASLTGLALAADKPKLDPQDATAKALDYTHESPIAAKRCGGCQLYKGSATSKWGKCAIFSGKLVNARGWCQSWSA